MLAVPTQEVVPSIADGLIKSPSRTQGIVRALQRGLIKRCVVCIVEWAVVVHGTGHRVTGLWIADIPGGTGPVQVVSARAVGAQGTTNDLCGVRRAVEASGAVQTVLCTACVDGVGVGARRAVNLACCALNAEVPGGAWVAGVGTDAGSAAEVARGTDLAEIRVVGTGLVVVGAHRTGDRRLHTERAVVAGGACKRSGNTAHTVIPGWTGGAVSGRLGARVLSEVTFRTQGGRGGPFRAVVACRTRLSSGRGSHRRGRGASTDAVKARGTLSGYCSVHAILPCGTGSAS